MRAGVVTSLYEDDQQRQTFFDSGLSEMSFGSSKVNKEDM